MERNESEAKKIVDDVDLSAISDGYCERVREMLKKHSRIWDGNLSEIQVTMHCIEFIPGARPVRSMPFRQGQKGLEFQCETVYKLLKQGAVVPSSSEWASPVVLATMPHKKGLSFCVDNRKLNP